MRVFQITVKEKFYVAKKTSTGVVVISEGFNKRPQASLFIERMLRRFPNEVYFIVKGFSAEDIIYE